MTTEIRMGTRSDNFWGIFDSPMREYYCHWCDEIVWVMDKDVITRPNGTLDWVCPHCRWHNDTPPMEEVYSD